MISQARPDARRATPEQLAKLVLLGSLAPARLSELARVAVTAHAQRGSDPLAEIRTPGQLAFLMRGELLLAYRGGGTEVLVGGYGEARYPLNRRAAAVARSRAITDVDLLVLEDETLDILMTFDQLTSSAGATESKMGRAVRTGSRVGSGVFSLHNLLHGAFAQLPPARIEELLDRFERISARGGEVIIREGEDGDYFYVIISGRCRVERTIGGATIAVAELGRGDAFGEEALASQVRRNATVVMLNEGELLRLAKRDFDALLREPLLQRISVAQGRDRVGRGAQLIDVRHPSEYRIDRLPGAVNVPLNEIRNSFAVLDGARELVVYCQSGRRSSAAAFLLARRGFNVFVLDGGHLGAKTQGEARG